MNKIKTYQDLLEIRKQYEAELDLRGELIRQDLSDLREEWRPVTDLLSKFSKATGKGKINPLGLFSFRVHLGSLFYDFKKAVSGGGGMHELHHCRSGYTKRY